LPLKGFKSVTVPEEAYVLAKRLVEVGLEENIGEAFSNALKEYVKRREQAIKELEAVKAKWKSTLEEVV